MESNTILTLILSAIITSVISTVVGIIIKKLLQKEFSRQEELNQYREEKHRKERKIDVLDTLRNEMCPIVDRLGKIEDQLNKNSDGTITLLRNEMKSDLDRYRNQGFASSSDKANWNELYNSYRRLGGNHFKEYVDQWKHEVEQFPLHEDE